MHDYLTAGTLEHAQTLLLPKSFRDSFHKVGLNRKCELQGYLFPSSLQADFNRNKIQDAALLVLEKASGEKGIMVIY